MVTIFNEGDITSFNAAYNVVVFPLPVGPVTSIIPSVFLIIFPNIARMSPSKPSLLKSNDTLDLSKIRSTIPSPYNIGITDTLRSISFPPTFNRILPS